VARSSAVAAVAALLIATRGPQGIPGERAEVIRIWGCGKDPLVNVYDALKNIGVSVEVRKYTTTVKGRRYRRCLLVIRDRKLVSRIRRAARKGKLAGMIRRSWKAVSYVLSRAKLRRWRDLAAMLPEPVLKRITGVRPFDKEIYVSWRHKLLARELRPGRWRVYLFVRKLKGVLYEAAVKAWVDGDFEHFKYVVKWTVERLTYDGHMRRARAEAILLEGMDEEEAYRVFLKRRGYNPDERPQRQGRP